MNDIVQSILAAFIATSVVVFGSVSLSRLQFLLDIRRYNKTHTEHSLDEHTPLKTFQQRQRDWLLEMFCDEKKGNKEKK